MVAHTLPWLHPVDPLPHVPQPTEAQRQFANLPDDIDKAQVRRELSHASEQIALTRQYPRRPPR
jgi:hypothetical protein